PRPFSSNDEYSETPDAYGTLYEVLVTFAKVMETFMSLVSDYVYQHLVRQIDEAAPASVHFCDYPEAIAGRIDTALEERMAIVRSIVGLGRKLRDDKKLKVRQPLASLTVVSRDPAVLDAARATAS